MPRLEQQVHAVDARVHDEVKVVMDKFREMVDYNDTQFGRIAEALARVRENCDGLDRKVDSKRYAVSLNI